MKTEQIHIVWMEFYLAVVKCCEDDCLTHCDTFITKRRKSLGSVTRIIRSNGARTFRVQPLEEVILTINTHCLCRDGKSHRLQVREREYSTTAGDISLLIYLIFCKFLAFLMIFSELRDEMVHIYDNST